MKIAFFANDDFYLYRYRLNLMKKLVSLGHEVFACARGTDKDFISKIEKEGISFNPLNLKRGISLFSSLLYFFQVYSLSREESFDLCHNFSFKAAVIGTLAQNLAGVKKIFFSITGLGYAYSSKSLKARILKLIANFGYSWAVKKAKGVVFQNSNDRKYFINKKIVREEKTYLIRGSGVDVDFFSSENSDIDRIEKRKELKIEENKKVIFLVSRLLESKGIKDFYNSAKILSKKYKDWEFVLAGIIDKANPEGIKIEEIREWEKEGSLRYIGERKDVRDILAISDLFVFPSYYREGVPKVILEAMSMSLPVIVAENFGTQEAVKNEENGLVVSPKNEEELAKSIEKVLLNKDLSLKLGQLAREEIIKNFSDEVVIKKTIEIYGT